MKHPNRSKSMHLTFILFFLVIIVVSAYIVRPFFTIILLSAMLAYALHPAYKGFVQMVKNESLAAFIVVFLVLFLVLAPMVLVVGTMTNESVQAYKYVRVQFSGGKLIYCQNDSNFGCKEYLQLKEFGDKYGLDFTATLKDGVTSLASSLVSWASKVVINLPIIFLKLFFVLFITYYFLKQGKDWLLDLKKAMPMDKRVTEDIVKKFNNVLHATIYGSIVLGIIQGIVAIVGYWILGAPAPILFGLITFIAVFIPYIGGAIIWAPLSIWMLYHAITTGNVIMIYQSIGVMLYGLFIISTIDNILKPKIIGDKAKMHPLIILLGVFGGIAVFGLVGILVGPLILALFMTTLEIYEAEREHFNF